MTHGESESEFRMPLNEEGSAPGRWSATRTSRPRCLRPPSWAPTTRPACRLRFGAIPCLRSCPEMATSSATHGYGSRC